MTTDPPWGSSDLRDSLLQQAAEVEHDGNMSYALANHLAVVTIDVLDWALAWTDPSVPDPAALGFPGPDGEGAVVVPGVAAQIARLRSALGLSEAQLEHRLCAAYVYFAGHSKAWTLAGVAQDGRSFELAWRCLTKALAAQGHTSSPPPDDPA